MELIKIVVLFFVYLIIAIVVVVGIAILPLVPEFYLDAYFTIATIVVVAIPIIYAYWKSNNTEKKIEKYLQETIPEKIGEKSYIDKNTGAIVLRSFDYHTRNGKEWVVSHSAITVNYNDTMKPAWDNVIDRHRSSLSQTTPFSAIQTIDMNDGGGGGALGALAFTVLGTRGIYNPNNGITQTHVEQVVQDNIIFVADDLPFAHQIVDRIAGM